MILFEFSTKLFKVQIAIVKSKKINKVNSRNIDLKQIAKSKRVKLTQVKFKLSLNLKM